MRCINDRQRCSTVVDQRRCRRISDVQDDVVDLARDEREGAAGKRNAGRRAIFAFDRCDMIAIDCDRPSGNPQHFDQHARSSLKPIRL